MALIDQVRRNLFGDSAPRLPPSAAPSERPPERRALVDQLRREVDRIQRRDRPVARSNSLQHTENMGLSVEHLPLLRRPDTVDEAGLLFRELFDHGQRFGRALLERPDPPLIRSIRRLVELVAADPAGACALERADQLLFLDLETTGLSRSAGTLAFVIGVAAWNDALGGFAADQIFLDDPGREPEALELLAGYLERAEVVVTFNGLGFDLPLLRNRATLCRVPLGLERPVQLDLLPPARRLFRPRLENCRQKTLEADLLGFRRQDDVDGAEAPRLYREYLRLGVWEGVSQVMDHNRLDITMMCPLLCTTARHAADPLTWAEDAEELLGCGELFRLAGDRDRAEACWRRGLELARVPATRRRLLEALAHQRRRVAGRQAAAPLWERHLREFPDYPTAWVELAKYHEHDRKDIGRALDLARRAPGQADPRLRHRVERLVRKSMKKNEI